MRLYPAQNYIPVDAVKKNPLQQLFHTQAGIEKRGFSQPRIVRGYPETKLGAKANLLDS
jgi:hypothetical protein